MGGSIASMSYRDSRVGQQQTAKVIDNPSDTPAQRRVRTNLDDASLGWTALSKSEKALWDAYGATQKRKDAVTGRAYALTGRESYVGLGSRFALMDPLSTIPSRPPTTRFAGDSLAVTTQPGGARGTVTFVASASNKAGVKTELMGVRLASADRSPAKPDDVSLAFVAFDEGDGNTADVALAPGTWALGYRFVSALSGEAKPVVDLGTMAIGLSVVQGGLDDEAESAARAA